MSGGGWAKMRPRLVLSDLVSATSAEPTSPHASRGVGRRPRLLYICDWLPPDFGAVGQYAELHARRCAESGMDVVLGGLSSRGTSQTTERYTDGSLKVTKLFAKPYRKDEFIRRLWWTFVTNTRLCLSLWRDMSRADEIMFTGSPPLILHWIAPLNVILRKRLRYRITDFHPECLMAACARPAFALDMIYRLTLFWRRRVDTFEVLGDDQRRRLEDIKISPERIRLVRDPSPVSIPPGTASLPRPAEHAGKVLLLYSGNWGVAHDYQTFVEGYRRHHEQGSGRIVLWLNAVGGGAQKVEECLNTLGLPLVRGAPVDLADLANLLVTPDAHLITLSNPFVGFVLPSKVHGCVLSGKPIMFIGSVRSDVHALCRARGDRHYWQVDVGDAEACAAALEQLAETAGSSIGETACDPAVSRQRSAQ